MKINKKFRPEKAVAKSDDPHNPNSKIFITSEKVLAGDGRIAVILPVKMQENDAIRNLVDPYIFREARSYTDKENDFLEMQFKGDDAEGKVVLKNGIELPYQLVKADKDLIPPDYNALIPEGKPKFQIALNLSLLSRVAHALGSGTVVLHYYGLKVPMKVTPIDPIEDEVGFISLTHGDDTNE